MRVLLLICAFIAAMMLLEKAPKAKPVSDQCKAAKNTADILVCANKTHEQAQEKLNEIYQKVLDLQDDKTRDAFLLAQKDWIDYRDGECAWEADKTESESLRRIGELNCLTELTEERTKTLLKSVESKEEIEEEKIDGVLPRWMNVVAVDHPDIFWRYGDSLSADIDCDGQDEEIMAGQQVQFKDVRVEKEPAHLIHAAIAITDNPMTGQPKTELLKLSVAQDQDHGDLCDPNIAFTVEHEPETAAGVCLHFLEIKDPKCKALKLFWDGQSYQVAPMPKS